MEHTTLEIQGMSCDHCVQAVSRVLERVDGVTVEHVEIGWADVSFDPERTSADAIVEAVSSHGYQASLR